MMIEKSALLLQTTTNTFYHCFSKQGLYFASSFGGQNVSRAYDFQLFTFGRRNG